MNAPDEPPPPPEKEKPEPPLGFGIQVGIGIMTIILLGVLAYLSRSGQLLMWCIAVVPLTAIGCCFYPKVRGFGVGLLLGYGLAALATLGICAAGMKGI